MTSSDSVSHTQQRSFAYNLIASTLDYPDTEFAQLVSDGKLGKQFKTTFCAIYPEMEQEIDWPSLAINNTGEDLEVEYSRLFDVGASGPPCPLNSGAYLDERMQALEECVRFYNYFDLTAGEDFEELPDHVTTQLEFMHYLTHCENELSDDKEQAENYQRAQRDFLNRQLGKWIPQLNEKVIDNDAKPFYLTLIKAIALFIEIEKRQTNEITGVIAIN